MKIQFYDSFLLRLNSSLGLIRPIVVSTVDIFFLLFCFNKFYLPYRFQKKKEKKKKIIQNSPMPTRRMKANERKMFWMFCSLFLVKRTIAFFITDTIDLELPNSERQTNGQWNEKPKTIFKETQHTVGRWVFGSFHFHSSFFVCVCVFDAVGSLPRKKE